MAVGMQGRCRSALKRSSLSRLFRTSGECVSSADCVLRVRLNIDRIFVTVSTSDAPVIDPGFSAALIRGPNDNITSQLFIFQNEGPESEMLRPIHCKYPRRRWISGVDRFERFGSYGLGWHGG
jgi:hypothetical protein